MLSSEGDHRCVQVSRVDDLYVLLDGCKRDLQALGEPGRDVAPRCLCHRRRVARERVRRGGINAEVNIDASCRKPHGHGQVVLEQDVLGPNEDQNGRQAVESRVDRRDVRVGPVFDVPGVGVEEVLIIDQPAGRRLSAEVYVPNWSTAAPKVAIPRSRRRRSVTIAKVAPAEKPPIASFVVPNSCSACSASQSATASQSSGAPARGPRERAGTPR